MNTNYHTYSERKLYSALNTARANISKLQSEKNRIDKKIESATKKELAIKQALINRLIPNEQTAYDLKNSAVLPQYTSHEQLISDIEKEIANENDRD